jgi:hypothetical protein
MVTSGGSRVVYNGSLNGSPAERCSTRDTSAAGLQSGCPGRRQRVPAALSRPAVQSAAGTGSLLAEVRAQVAAESEKVAALPPCVVTTAGMQHGIGGPAVLKAAEARGAVASVPAALGPLEQRGGN